MQYQGAGPRFEHKLIQLQRERQSGQLNAEVYENQLTALIEEEVMSQEQEWQAARRGQLWAQAQERWNYLEHGNEPKALLVQEQQEEGQHFLLQPQRAEEEKALPQTLEEKLLAARTRFYAEEASMIVDKYKDDARKYRRIHDRLQVAIIIGSALATSTTGATIFTGATTISIVLKIIAAFFSLAVTIASGSIAYFKYKERSNDTQKAADTIEDDSNALKLGTGIYRGKSMEESLSIFAENTNDTISEHKKKQQLLDQPPEAKSGQVGQ